MKERVNIQYSIDIDELPRETGRLLSQSTDYLANIANEVSEWNFDDNKIMSLDTMSKIDTLRQNIARLDYMLNDVHSLVASFINYKTKPPEADTTASPEQQATQASQITQPPPDMADLQRKIEIFRNSLEGSEIIESPNEVTS